MGLLDSIKSLFSGKAKEAVSSLGLDDAAVSSFETLLAKLKEGNLSEAASKAVETFKPVLEKFKNKEISADSFVEKAKTFLDGLGDNLPSSVSGLVEKLKGLLNK